MDNKELKKQFFAEYWYIDDHNEPVIKGDAEEVWQWIMENYIPKPKPEKKTKEERGKEFSQKVNVVSAKPDMFSIPEQELKNFISYWTESGETQKKMRFEMEKVFDIKRRLNTWMRNKKDFQPKQEISKTTEQIYKDLGF